MWLTQTPDPLGEGGLRSAGGVSCPATLATVLLEGLEGTGAAICLSDADDNVRFLNAAFREAFLPDVTGQGVNFTDAICETIASGRGIRLESMPLERFRQSVRERRRSGRLFAFCVDCHDGRWWRMEDHRLSNGWILAVGTDISATKGEELRLREAHADALKASRTDFLTGLPNRRCAMEEAQAALDHARAQREILTLALLDIDHFKQINDRHGHDAGDAVLIHFAQELTRRLGCRDRTSRIGGEEFMVLMPGTPLTTGRLRLERLLRTVTTVPASPGREAIAFAFSGGAVCPRPGEPLKSVLARADAALYAAKSAGRGRIGCAPDVASHVA